MAMFSTKEEYLASVKKKYDELNYQWNVERNKFEAKIQHESAHARKKLLQEREELRRLRKEVKEKIIDLEVAGENAWNDLKDGPEKSWKELRTAFGKATGNFKN
jgi:hypothetical protein